MRLELADFPVTRVNLGDKFEYSAKTLDVNEEQLISLIHQDCRIRHAEVAVVTPGERVRVIGVRDVVEPRVKVRGRGQVFPGILGPVEPVGDGRTHRLSGMAVVVTAKYEGTIRAGTLVQRSTILDMWGPGAEASRFSSQINLVLVLRLVAGLPEIEAHSAIQQAAYQAAKTLAETTIGVDPARAEVFQLDSATSTLPRVVLIQACLTDSVHAHSGVSYYGLPIRASLATLVHPNEFLDGAMGVDTTRCVGYYPTTWDWQNHPLILGLYRDHSSSLNFAGVILERIRFETYHGKEVAAHSAAQLASALRADGALVAWLGSGNAFVDVMLTIKACEQRGIKTVLVTYEYGGKDGADTPLLYYVPEAGAVVSAGSHDRWLELPAPERVVGPYEQVKLLTYPGAPLVSANEPLRLDARDMMVGGLDNWGSQSWTCKAH